MNHFFYSGLKNYFEYLYIKENPNSTYDFNDIINYKKQKICHFKNYIYKYNKHYDKQYDWFKNVNEININYDPLNLNTRFIDYINKSFIFKKINDNEYIFERNETDNITKLFYHYNSNINTGNFGDIISYYLFEKLTGYQHVYYDIANTHYDDYHYIINGNIINNKSIIWGFGINNLYLNKNINQYKIYCVRGKNTRKLLLDNDINIYEKYGDPILIMPLLYNKKVNKIYNYGIILDINDYEFINNYFGTLQNIKIINLIIQKDNNSIENLIDIINSCEIIVSSSLCGIIISHAYNIPVIRFKQSHIHEDEINFLDYFESVYSYYYETTYDITYIISNINEIIKKYKKPDMIKDRQIDLINSCPFIDNCLKNMLIKMII